MENTNTGTGTGNGTASVAGGTPVLPKEVAQPVVYPGDVPSGQVLTPPQKQAKINAELNALLEKMATAPVTTDAPIVSAPVPPTSVAASMTALNTPFHSSSSAILAAAASAGSMPHSPSPVAAPAPTAAPTSMPGMMPKPPAPAPVLPPKPRPLNPLPTASVMPSAPTVPAALASSFVPSRPTAQVGSTQGASLTQSAFVASQPRVSKVEFSSDPAAVTKAYASASSGGASTSSHKMLWLMVFLTMLFLAAIGGAAYWYFKVYSPLLLDNPVSPTVNSGPGLNPPRSAFPTGVNPNGNAAMPARATTSPRVLVPAKPVRSQVVPAFSPAQQAEVSAYIKANINSLAPVKSSLGYTVTDMTFDGPDRGIVEYGNAKVHYAAVAVAYIDTSGNVHVTSFTILEK